MKILIMMTGGTISTTVGDGGNLHADGKKTVSLLSREYYKRSGLSQNDVRFEYSHPLDVLSENMTFPRLNILLDELRCVSFNKYDGVIVAHGTDTLAYTSTLLALTLAGKTDKPVFLVSSDYTLTDNRANGHDNFSAACELILKGFGAGVYVPYRNSDGVTYLHHGAHLRQCANFTGDFFSYDMVSYTVAKPYHIAVEHPMLDALRYLDECVMRIDPYVGIDYSAYRPGKDIRAVLHIGYHSATACSERTAVGEPYTKRSVLYLINKCKAHGIDTYLSPLEEAMRLTSGRYSTTADIIRSGMKPLYSLTNEAAYMKLALAYSLGYEGEEIIPFIDRDICGEKLSL